jgi:hypothetical protein
MRGSAAKIRVTSHRVPPLRDVSLVDLRTMSLPIIKPGIVVRRVQLRVGYINIKPIRTHPAIDVSPWT